MRHQLLLPEPWVFCYKYWLYLLSIWRPWLQQTRHGQETQSYWNWKRPYQMGIVWHYAKNERKTREDGRIKKAYSRLQIVWQTQWINWDRIGIKMILIIGSWLLFIWLLSNSFTSHYKDSVCSSHYLFSLVLITTVSRSKIKELTNSKYQASFNRKIDKLSSQR